METLRIAIVAHDYPSPEDWHKGAFVQARANLYERMGHQVAVWSRQYRQSVDSNYDVVAVHYPLPEYAIPVSDAFPKSTPKVAFLHGSEVIRLPREYKKFWWQWMNRGRVQRFLRRCDAVVTCSRWMQKEIEAETGLRPQVIPNPVDPELFPLMEHTTERGLCLRGHHRKYGTDLIDGLPGIDILEPNYHRWELPELLGRYGFFVAPSRLEGQGLMACEAAATGMPVLSTHVGGIPEFLDVGLHHLVLNVETAYFIEEIQELLGRLPLSGGMAKVIRHSVLNQCGPAVTVEKDIQLFKRLMG